MIVFLLLQDNEDWGRQGIRSIAVARTNAQGEWVRKILDVFWFRLVFLWFRDIEHSNISTTLEAALD